jgi:hypothetical protein
VSENKSPGDRLLELVVFAPTGLAVTLVEEFPRFVEKGRHRVEGQVHTARLVGQFAVQMGRRQLEQTVGHFVGQPTHDSGEPDAATPGPAPTPAHVPTRPSPPGPTADVTGPAPRVPSPRVDVTTPRPHAPAPKVEAPTPKAEVPTPKVEVPTPQADVPTPKTEVPSPKAEVPAPTGDGPAPRPYASTPRPGVTAPKADAPTYVRRPDAGGRAGDPSVPPWRQPGWLATGGIASASASSLAIPGYDSLSASQVVQRLEGLSTRELEEVRAHEAAHRQRRTILHRVEQLLSGGDSVQL